MVVVSTLQTANYDVKEKLHREKSAGGELIELSKQFGESKGAHGVKLVVLEVLESQRGRNSFKFRVLSLPWKPGSSHHTSSKFELQVHSRQPRAFDCHMGETPALTPCQSTRKE